MVSKKSTTDYNPNLFSDFQKQWWGQTSPAIAICVSETRNCSENHVYEQINKQNQYIKIKFLLNYQIIKELN